MELYTQFDKIFAFHENVSSFFFYTYMYVC